MDSSDSEWMQLPPMASKRAWGEAVLLPDGKVLVVGGQANDKGASALSTAELWDQATQAWTIMPPMSRARTECHICLLPSGRVAVFGGCVAGVDDDDDEDWDGNPFGRYLQDGEAFDLERRVWEPLPDMRGPTRGGGLAMVAGGLVVAYSAFEDGRYVTSRDALFDEESGRWFGLPPPMLHPKNSTQLVAVPASVLLQPGGAAAQAS